MKTKNVFLRVLILIPLIVIILNFINEMPAIQASPSELSIKNNESDSESELPKELKEANKPQVIMVDEEGNIIENQEMTPDNLGSTTRAVDPVWGDWSNWQKNYTYSTSVAAAKGLTSLGSYRYNANMNWKVNLLQGDTHSFIIINNGAFQVFANKATSITPKKYTATGEPTYFTTDSNGKGQVIPSTGTGYGTIKTWSEGTILRGGPSFYFLADSSKYACFTPPVDNKNHTLTLDVNFDYVTTDAKGYTTLAGSNNTVLYYYPSGPFTPQLIKAKYIDVDTGQDIGGGLEVQGTGGYYLDKYDFSAKDISNYTYQYRVESDENGNSTKNTDSTNKSVTKTMTINKQGIVFYYKKTPKSTLSVNKFDAENRSTKLANATIQLYDADKNLIGTKTTDGINDIKFENIDVGNYYLKETTAPSGYGIDNAAFVPITLTTSGARYDFYDTKLKSTISANKFDAESRTTKLAGATIELYDSSKKLLTSKVTDGTNDIKFEQLVLGTYYLKETTAPSGYGIDNTAFVPITLTTSGARYDFYDTKLKSTISANKFDAESRTTKLAGATIELYDSNKKLLTSKVTDGTNDIKFEQLVLGTYYLKETTAPSGYGIDNTAFVPIALTTSGARYDFYDTKLKGDILVKKADNSDATKMLSGAEIALYDTTGKQLASSVTDENGEARFSQLIIGDYLLKEIKAPTGYRIDNPEFVSVSVEAGKKATYTFLDTKLILEKNLYIRQVVLAPNSELTVPTTGYFKGKEIELTNLGVNKTYGLDSISETEDLSKQITVENFTKYKLNLSVDYQILDIKTLIPEYYAFVGSQVTANEATIAKDHVSTQTITKPNDQLSGNALSTIRLDYNKNSKEDYFVTIYLTPNEYTVVGKSPKYYNWDYQINEFPYIKI